MVTQAWLRSSYMVFIVYVLCHDAAQSTRGMIMPASYDTLSLLCWLAHSTGPACQQHKRKLSKGHVLALINPVGVHGKHGRPNALKVEHHEQAKVCGRVMNLSPSGIPLSCHAFLPR